jgi:hypothetical protein
MLPTSTLEGDQAPSLALVCQAGSHLLRPPELPLMLLHEARAQLHAPCGVFRKALQEMGDFRTYPLRTCIAAFFSPFVFLTP